VTAAAHLRPRTRLEDAPPWVPAAVVAALVALHVAVFVPLTWMQHSRWASLGFDTGIYDQGIWLVTHGRDPFMTVRGMDYWGHHVSAVAYLFTPIYLLGGGIHALTAVHTTVVALGAIPLWLLAKERVGNPWAALVVPFAYLLHPAVHWVTWWLYHPDSLAITPLLFAWWLARRAERLRDEGRSTRSTWIWLGLALFLAMTCKEDVSLAVLVLGVVLVARGQRRPGAVVALAGIAWFAVCSRLIIPWRNDHAPAFYESYFPYLGASLGEIARNIVLHPTRPLRLLGRPRTRDYALKMLGPLGFIGPFLGLAALLVAGPQLGVNLLVEVQNGATIKSQYASIPIVGIFLGLAEGMALLATRPRARRAFVTGLVICSLAGTHLWGLGPLGRPEERGNWSRRPASAIAVREEARNLVPPTAGVAASWDLVTHFTHRQAAYEFPNPWRSSNYGPSGNEVGDPTTVDWIAVDTAVLGPSDAHLLAALTAPDGGFEIVFSRSEVVVARRTGPDTLRVP
jgi:uncharacterized membrane protein